MNLETKTINIPADISYDAIERLLYPSQVANIVTLGGVRKVTYKPCCAERERDEAKAKKENAPC